MNDDFGKETYVKPSIVDDTKRPYYLWSTVTAVYEFALPTSLTVMIVFTCLEFPMMVLSKYFDENPLYLGVVVMCVHTFPQILQMLEWQYNSIPISWHRFPIYITIQTCYILVHVAYSADENNANLYKSLNWSFSP